MTLTGGEPLNVRVSFFQTERWDQWRTYTWPIPIVPDPNSKPWLRWPRSTCILVSVWVTSRPKNSTEPDLQHTLRPCIPVLVVRRAIRVCHKTEVSQRDAPNSQLRARRTLCLASRIWPLVGVGIHCWGRRIWQFRSGRVCPASQFPCWSMFK